MSTATKNGTGGRFNAFSGVFTPSILTILGVVMYLRFGWVTGQVGLGGCLLIVVISHLISLTTGLSVSSIATNRQVGAGGAYYMISRGLGAPAGAAIGIPLFFAQALSVTFYIVGFTESLMHLMPAWMSAALPAWLISTVVNIGLTALSYKSADLAIRAQFVVMGVIVVSLVSFFMGGNDEPARATAHAIEWWNPDGAPFTQVFAVFFPAVTGIMAGVSMSGDLEDPRRALPKGTLAAIAVGFIIYFAVPIKLSMNHTNAELVEHLDIVFTTAIWGGAIYLGVWGATLSSALGSIMTAPRTLQALAMDGLVPSKLGEGHGPQNEPRVGTIVTLMIAQAGILVGSLDAIAPVLTMFFLATYGVTNLVCALQRWADSPSFRPSFRVPAWISVAGGLGCFYVMSIIDTVAMVVALSLCALIYMHVQRRELGVGHSDARHGIWSALVRTSLHRLRRTEYSALNWRPNLAILAGDPNRHAYLLELGAALVQNRGIVSYHHVIEGDVMTHADERARILRDNEVRITERYPLVFYRTEVTPDRFVGWVSAAQSHGIGNLEVNAAMFAHPAPEEREQGYMRCLRELVALDQTVLMVRPSLDRAFGDGRQIDVWWQPGEQSPATMLLLAFLMVGDERWRRARVRLLSAVHDPEDEESYRDALGAFLDAARLDAELVIVPSEGRERSAIMREASNLADLVILCLPMPSQNAVVEEYFDRLDELTEGLPTTMFVRVAKHLQTAPLLVDE